MDRYQDEELITVIPAVLSLDSASPDLLKAVDQMAQEKKIPWHVHLAMTRGERDSCLTKTKKAPVAYLESLGVLSEYCTCVHATWLDDEEISLLAKKQSGVIYTPSSNMFMGEGVTRIRDLIQAGASVSLATGGGCRNNRSSVLEEMRMASLLQKVTYQDPTVSSAESMFY